MSDKNRLAALVVRKSHDGTPLILAVVPTQANVAAGDFTYTTPTCHGGRNNSITHIADHVCDMLGIGRAALIQEATLLSQPVSAKKKTYKWFLFEVNGEVAVKQDSSLVWVAPVAMEAITQYMSPTRLVMFQSSLKMAVQFIPELSAFDETILMPIPALA